MTKILTVEDDKEISRLVADFLKENGYEVITAFDGLKVCETIEKESPDLVLLDLMLPYKNGDMVLSDIRISQGDDPE